MKKSLILSFGIALSIGTVFGNSQGNNSICSGINYSALTNSEKSLITNSIQNYIYKNYDLGYENLRPKIETINQNINNLISKYSILSNYNAYRNIHGLCLIKNTLNTNSNLSYTKKTYTEQTNLFNINIDYPTFDNKEINGSINNFILKQVGEFKKSITGYEAFSGWKYELNIDYKLYYMSGNIGVKFNISDFQGGAHPNHRLETFNFTNNGNTIDLTKYLNQNSVSLKQISNYSYEYFKKKYPIKDTLFVEGFDPNENNLSNFIITNKGIILFFPPYQITPYSEGEQQLQIDFKNIK